MLIWLTATTLSLFNSLLPKTQQSTYCFNLTAESLLLNEYIQCK